MKTSELELLKYPIGKFIAPKIYTEAYLAEKIKEIEDFPEKIKRETLSLTNEQLDTRYRPEGWTIRQVIHHCAESHMNCYIRIKWALTENKPTIKYYHEDLWSELNDSLTMPIAPTILLLEGLHFRLAYLMKSLSKNDIDKSFIHPAQGKEYQIKEIIGTYAWHSKHHLAHITELKKRNNWKNIF